MDAKELDVSPGDIVEGLEPAELVEIRRISSFGDKMLIEGVGTQSHLHITRPLSHEELTRLVKVRGAARLLDGDPKAFLLGAEAARIRIAYQFDPLFAVNSSVVDPLPHQVEAVYRYLLPLPRIRFLLADDTGAGKTIMTGLLIKELLFRGVIKRILIITPGGLTKQWKEDELQEKFSLSARLVNRGSFDAEPDQFSRYGEGIFVVSIDFLARNEGCRNAAQATQWDFVVVDEAHKLSAYEYGSKLDTSKRYEAVEAIARNTDHLLFLTATPHRGRKDTFRRLLMLLDEDLFQKDQYVSDRVHEQTEAYRSPQEEGSLSRARNRFFLRRLKEEMVNWDETPLFKPRHTKTIGYDLTPQEKLLYDEVTRYVRSKRRQAKSQKNRNVELTLLVMQRRLASSISAITKTLKRRLDALDEVIEILTDPHRSEAERQRLLRGGLGPDDPRDIAEYEGLDEDEREQVDQRIFRQVLTDDPDKVAEERTEVERLHKLASSLKEHKEAKYLELLAVLDSSDIIRSDDEKLLIFTEHRDTLESLVNRLEDKGYKVSTIHGGMNVDQRKRAQQEFHRHSKIMVATDAAGEGINLQFCRYMINWDIPWNPNRLEQRMGRIHRYGQNSDVWVFNLVARNTREGAVLQKVLSKMDVMREQMGSDRVYDVIDEWLEEVPLVKLMEKAIDSDEESGVETEVDRYLDSASRERVSGLIELQKKTSFASRLDIHAARELRDASDEKRLQPMFIQRFFERAWRACGGTMIEDPHFPVWHLSPVPAALKKVAPEVREPVPEKYDTPFVFDKNLLSVASMVHVPEYTRLLGPGHPLFDTLIEWAIKEAHEAFAKGTRLVDPNLSEPKRIWLVRSTIEDGRLEREKRLAHERFIVIFLDHSGLRATSPSYLLDCLPPEDELERPAPQQLKSEEIQNWVYNEITEKQLESIHSLRQEECDLRREYLLETFTDLIVERQGELNELQQAQLFGEANYEEAEKLHMKIEDLKQRRRERLAELDRMLRLRANLPEILTEAAVVPAPSVIEEGLVTRGIPMRRDDEVERIAMEVAENYECSRGWSPIDVSQEGEHYDIRSVGPNDEKRYIEVKGRAQSGAIMLTGPEVDKLRQLENRAWLYIVTFCKGERPSLRIIQNPLSNLNPKMLYRQVQFLVEEDDWASKGEEIKAGG